MTLEHESQESTGVGPVGVATGEDNPSSGAQAPGSQGSPATKPTAPAAAEHRDERPTLTDEDIERLAREDPRLRSLIARQSKSMADKAAAEARRKMQEQQRVEAEEARRRQREEEDLAADEYELGKKRKEEIQQRRAAEPFIREYFEQGHSEGYSKAFQEMGAALNRSPYWQQLSSADRQVLIDSHPEFADLVQTVIDRTADWKATQRMDKELAKFRQAQDREERAAARDAEPTPEVGSGQAAAVPFRSVDEVHAAYSEGRFGTTRDPYGGLARKKYAEALAQFGETP